MYAIKDITLSRQSAPVVPGGRSSSGREQSPYHFFFGNENTLELYSALREKLVLREHKYIGVLEMPAHQQALPEARGLLVDVVVPGSRPAEQAIRYLSGLEQELWELWKNGTFYLAGKEDAINEFKKVLIEDKHILPVQIRYYYQFS